MATTADCDPILGHLPREGILTQVTPVGCKRGDRARQRPEQGRKRMGEEGRGVAGGVGQRRCVGVGVGGMESARVGRTALALPRIAIVSAFGDTHALFPPTDAPLHSLCRDATAQTPTSGVQHFLREQIQLLLRQEGFNMLSIEKLEYSLRHEFGDIDVAVPEDLPPWDWLILCQKTP